MDAGTETDGMQWTSTTAASAVVETFVAHCLGCQQEEAGGRTNWTWTVHEGGVERRAGRGPNFTASQYDTLDAQEDFPRYEIDPAYQLRYSILGTVLLT